MAGLGVRGGKEQMATLDEIGQEKQRISERLAGLDSERTKRGNHLNELLPRPNDPDSVAAIPPRHQPGAMPLAGLAKVEAHRFNPQPMLSSHTRPAVPARRTKNRPRCENSGLTARTVGDVFLALHFDQ